MSSLKIIFAGTLFLLLTSCNSKKAEKEAPAINQFEKGSAFVIILPENHTTGYSWQLNSGYNTGVIDYMASVWHGNEKGIYFNFNGLAVGQTTLTFVKRKYTDTLSVKSFIVKIVNP